MEAPIESMKHRFCWSFLYNEYGIYSEDLNNTLFHFKNNVLDTYIF